MPTAAWVSLPAAPVEGTACKRASVPPRVQAGLRDPLLPHYLSASQTINRTKFQFYIFFYKKFHLIRVVQTPLLIKTDILKKTLLKRYSSSSQDTEIKPNIKDEENTL